MSDPIATSDIYFGDPGRGVLAFTKGQKVPAHLVKDNGWEDFVASPSAKSGKQAQSAAAPAGEEKK